MNTPPRLATPASRPAQSGARVATADVHQRASLEGLDVRLLRFELWLLAGGERRSTRRPKSLQG